MGCPFTGGALLLRNGLEQIYFKNCTQYYLRSRLTANSYALSTFSINILLITKIKDVMYGK